MRYISLLFCFLFLVQFFPAYGQRKAKVDTVAAFRAFNEGNQLLKAGKYDSAMTNYQVAADGYKAYALSLPLRPKFQVNRNKAYIRCFQSIHSNARTLMLLGKYKESLIQLKNATNECSVYCGQQAFICPEMVASVGSAYLYLNELDSAIRYYNTALETYSQITTEPHPKIAIIHSNLGIAYFKKANWRKSEQHQLKSIAIKRKLFGDSSLTLSNSLNNLGGLYADMKDYQQAEASYLKSLSIRRALLR
jgi:tetratricopeptide (TPR) repeat protein